MADFFESLNNIYRDADKDPELRGWFSSINTYIRYDNLVLTWKKTDANIPQQMSA